MRKRLTPRAVDFSGDTHAGLLPLRLGSTTALWLNSHCCLPREHSPSAIWGPPGTASSRRACPELSQSRSARRRVWLRSPESLVAPITSPWRRATKPRSNICLLPTSHCRPAQIRAVPCVARLKSRSCPWSRSRCLPLPKISSVIARDSDPGARQHASAPDQRRLRRSGHVLAGRHWTLPRAVSRSHLTRQLKLTRPRPGL